MANVKIAMEYAAKMNREALKNGTSELGPPFDKIYDKQEWTEIFGPNLVEVLNAAGFYKKKEWVGLTDEEMRLLLDDEINKKHANWLNVCRAIEAKLKEKK